MCLVNAPTQREKTKALQALLIFFFFCFSAIRILKSVVEKSYTTSLEFAYLHLRFTLAYLTEYPQISSLETWASSDIKIHFDVNNIRGEELMGGTY